MDSGGRTWPDVLHAFGAALNEGGVSFKVALLVAVVFFTGCIAGGFATNKLIDVTAIEAEKNLTNGARQDLISYQNACNSERQLSGERADLSNQKIDLNNQKIAEKDNELRANKTLLDKAISDFKTAQTSCADKSNQLASENQKSIIEKDKAISEISSKLDICNKSLSFLNQKPKHSAQPVDQLSVDLQQVVARGVSPSNAIIILNGSYSLLGTGEYGISCKLVVRNVDSNQVTEIMFAMGEGKQIVFGSKKAQFTLTNASPDGCHFSIYY